MLGICDRTGRQSNTIDHRVQTEPEQHSDPTDAARRFLAGMIMVTLPRITTVIMPTVIMGWMKCPHQEEHGDNPYQSGRACF